MTQSNSSHAIIYGVIRGERPCADLFQLGITIELVDENWQITSPPLEAVKLHISDIAHGFLKYKSNPANLRKWARLILFGSSFIDLSKCETQTGWEVLLNALWDAMDTGTFNDAALSLAEELAN